MATQPPRNRALTRREMVAGGGAAGLGGLIVGGVGGFFGGRASKSGTATTTSAPAKGTPITIGGGVPVTGAFSGDGQEMRRGMELAIAEINAAGGLLGRPLKFKLLDTKEQAPNDMTTVVRKLVSSKVAAMFVPFTTYTSVEYPIAAASGIPMFHVNTYQGNADYVKKKGYTNIYQGDPTEIWYGPGFIAVTDELIASGAWKPRNKTAAVVTSNDAYSLSIARGFRDGVVKKGWKVPLYEQFTIPQTDWGPVLVKIRKLNPDIVFFSDYTAGDEASFIKQFRQSPTRSLVYEQYAPSVPEYLQLAGSAANGVLWSTVTGSILDDVIGQKFANGYQQKFKQNPGLANAGGQYDLVHMWALAAGSVGDPYDFKRVNHAIANMTYRGVNGAFHFQPGILSCYPYPDRLDDPSLGMAHLTFQIQNGKQVIVSPKPYTTGKFQLPGWM